MTFFGAGIVFVFVIGADDSLATTFGSTLGAGITFGAGTFTSRVANPLGFGSVFRLVFFSSSSSPASSVLSNFTASRFASRVPAGSSPRGDASPSTLAFASFIDTALNLALFRLFDAVATPPSSNNPIPNAASLPRFVPRTTALGLVTKNDTDDVTVVSFGADMLLRVKRETMASVHFLHRHSSSAAFVPGRCSRVIRKCNPSVVCSPLVGSFQSSRLARVQPRHHARTNSRGRARDVATHLSHRRALDRRRRRRPAATGCDDRALGEKPSVFEHDPYASLTVHDSRNIERKVCSSSKSDAKTHP